MEDVGGLLGEQATREARPHLPGVPGSFGGLGLRE